MNNFCFEKKWTVLAFFVFFFEKITTLFSKNKQFKKITILKKTIGTYLFFFFFWKMKYFISSQCIFHFEAPGSAVICVFTTFFFGKKNEPYLFFDKKCRIKKKISWKPINKFFWKKTNKILFLKKMNNLKKTKQSILLCFWKKMKNYFEKTNKFCVNSGLTKSDRFQENRTNLKSIILVYVTYLVE